TPPSAFINHQATRMQLHGRVGDHELDRLAIRERTAESRPYLRILDHHVERPLGDADGAGAVAADATFLNPLLRDGEALSFAADEVRRRHAHILEENLTGRVPHHR